MEMRKSQSAFAILYPFDNEIIDVDDYEDGIATIEENEKFVSDGVDALGYTDVERYANSYLVIWTGMEWERYG